MLFICIIFYMNAKKLSTKTEEIEKVVIILNEMLGENNRFREKVGV